MKNTAMVFLVILLVTSLSGCGDEKEPAQDEVASVSTDQAPAMGTISDTTYGVDSMGTDMSHATQVVHVVQKGETLWKISEQYLGSGRYWQKIVDANPGVDPAKLSVGQKLTIPVQ